LPGEVTILDARGQPMQRAPARPRPGALSSGFSNVPWDAADRYGSHMADWQPYLWSADGELNPYRDTITARIRDLTRNDGWASGTVTRILDNAVGANFRPIAKPDYRALATHTGIKAFDSTWAYEYSKALDASYRTFSNGRGRWCDVQRAMTAGQQYRVAFRHKLVDGDAIANMQYRLDRVGRGRARYATCIQLIDPDRLSNPQMRFDTHELRGGVEVDEDNAAIAYHIRRAHQGDWWSAGDSVRWDRIARETEDGRPIIVHDFDHDRAGQHRGGSGILAPVVQRLKMLYRYDVAELDASILNAVFGAWLESPFDPEFAESVFDAGEKIGGYQTARMDFHGEKPIRIPGAGGAMPTLFPGERVNQLNAARPSGNFIAFEKAALRNIASAAGLSAQQVSNDWSDVNYSSARGAMLEFWKTMTRRRDDFAIGFCQPIFTCFVEEAHEVDDLPMPAGAPDFLEFPDAYSRSKWIGPGRGWIDPVNEVKGAILGMDSALMDYDELCAEQGVDGDDMILARKHTIKRFEDAGVPLPSWATIAPGDSASKSITDPEAT
jgi:lambda family phage portal protein